ncbi:MAG: hypothetical protein J6C05_10995 [Prevotella sp.]|nr:hypothetical protein [Prevotella sp.]
MTENKKRKPYVKPSMEVIKVETMTILAGSGPERKSSIENFENDDYWEEVNATEQ